jgi:hypothetical protein
VLTTALKPLLSAAEMVIVGRFFERAFGTGWLT